MNRLDSEIQQYHACDHLLDKSCTQHYGGIGGHAINHREYLCLGTKISEAIRESIRISQVQALSPSHSRMEDIAIIYGKLAGLAKPALTKCFDWQKTGEA